MPIRFPITRLAWIPAAAMAALGASSSTDATPEDTEGARALVRSNTGFALELHRRLAGDDGNLLVSPFSISSALAMTWAGAREETARQMRDVLRFEDPEQVHPAFEGLLAGLREREAGGDLEFVVANALWGQRNFDFNAGFLDLLEQNYGAPLEETDFRAGAEAARETINSWVEDRTRERISGLVPRNALGPLTRLVLTNAVYFKGAWANPFPEHRTEEGAFKRRNGSLVSVPMMRQTGYFAYAENEEVQVLELPYEGNQLSLVVLLPSGHDRLRALEADLTAGRLEAWMEELSRSRVEVKLPRFRFTSETPLATVLREMGMNDAFSPRDSDFSGMARNAEDLHLSAVFHKAFIDVHEKGTEAAAATAAVAQITAIPADDPVPFHADRPFLFLLRDRPSGTLLFLGRVADPSAGETTGPE